MSNTKSRNITLPDYEYVVVGSGPGGAPLASRLALAGHSVLLIEAGEDHGSDLEVQIPTEFAAASEYAPIQWDYFVHHYANETQQARDSKMTYQTMEGDLYVGLNPPPNATPLGILYPRTGTLGGCAQHNALLTMLPQNSDWEYMQNLTGDNSWSVAHMRKYFEKLEKCEYHAGKSTGHGFNGWLSTTVTYPEVIYQDKKLLSMVKALVTTSGKNASSPSNSSQGLGGLLALDVNNDSPNKDDLDEVYQMTMVRIIFLIISHSPIPNPKCVFVYVYLSFQFWNKDKPI